MNASVSATTDVPICIQVATRGPSPRCMPKDMWALALLVGVTLWACSRSPATKPATTSRTTPRAASSHTDLQFSDLPGPFATPDANNPRRSWFHEATAAIGSSMPSGFVVAAYAEGGLEEPRPVAGACTEPRRISLGLQSRDDLPLSRPGRERGGNGALHVRDRLEQAVRHCGARGIPVRRRHQRRPCASRTKRIRRRRAESPRRSPTFRGAATTSTGRATSCRAPTGPSCTLRSDRRPTSMWSRIPSAPRFSGDEPLTGRGEEFFASSTRRPDRPLLLSGDESRSGQRSRSATAWVTIWSPITSSP